ncbi:carboxypeptidase regulatory-like domain-containing protein [Bremerella sp. JC770]|uniref:carboxypeptidase regulatory-like domain-containing protein n=1 Tax=Bremerella sp. JC770 TaxID=3232137 RepID=UPI00345A775D
MNAIFKPTLLMMLVALATSGGCFSSGASDLPEMGKVKGKVTLDGKPLNGAVVWFQSTTAGRMAFGTTNRDGEYELYLMRDITGACLGENQVTITSGQDDETKEVLPDRYHKDSTMTKTVEPGQNIFDFELTSED